MKNRIHTCLLLATAGLWAGGAHADDAPEDAASPQKSKVFEMGEILVVGKGLNKVPVGESAVTFEQMEQLSLDTVSAAIAIEPGVSRTRNSRNEETVFVRGFDTRQVPVFLDGIPLYVPYDGYVDFSRFTTFDLSEIRVGKGAASLLYGANTLGGAINLISRKPDELFEGDIRANIGSGQKRRISANLGTNQGLWYMQAGLSYLDVDSFPLADGFEDKKEKPTDTGDYRRNAYSTDKKISLKLGYTPNATDEYALGYSKQDGEKGNPVYTGESTQGIRYWRWPYWDKESVYFLSNTAFGEDNSLKIRVYYDEYDNSIHAYKDASYSSPGQVKYFPSAYHDINYGGSVQWTNRSFENHTINLAAHYKDDKHREVSPGPTQKYRDVTRSVALEDVISLSSQWSLRLGVSYEERESKEVYFWDTGETDATNGLAEVVYTFSPDIEIFGGISHKTRFPTIKDRYSARMGRALPNPDLDPEVAFHSELGFRGQVLAATYVEASIFYSRIDDLIQSSVVISSECGEETCEQAQNIGEARHRGVELALQQHVADFLSAGLSYTYMDRDNLKNSDTPLTGTPEHRLFAHATWHVNDAWDVLLTTEAESGRDVPFSGSGRSQFRDLSGYGIWGLKGIWQASNHLSIEMGFENIGDKNYELADGFPMPGRTWSISAGYDF
ncbi:MAG: TonB-dependent receptor plug domain-containing protein [Parahaliea sp.]